MFEQDIPADQLESNLRKLLDDFRALAGRYDPWKKCVQMNDKGIRFQVCEVADYDLARVRAEHHEEQFNRYFIDDCASLWAHARIYFLEEPLMTVRLSKLKGGGCVMGVRVTHGICDGVGLACVFMRFTQVCQGSAPPFSLLPRQAFPVAFEQTQSEVTKKMKEEGWSRVSLPFFIYRLHFNRQKGLSPFNRLRAPGIVMSMGAIQRLKAVAALDAQMKGLKPPTAISVNDALSGFLCQILARLFDFDDDMECAHNLKMDWRGRLEGLDPKYFGNASSGVLTTKFTPKCSLGEITCSINAGLSKFETDKAKMHEHAALNWGRAKYRIAATMANPATMPMLSSKPSTFIINNLARFPVYVQNFGVGKPTLVVPPHTGDEAVIWPRANGDGVELYFQGPSARAISKLTEEEYAWFEEEVTKFDKCGDIQILIQLATRNDNLALEGGLTTSQEQAALKLASLINVSKRPKPMKARKKIIT